MRSSANGRIDFSMLFQVIAVGAGGCLGAISRFLFGAAFQRLIPSHFPFSTLLINVIGAFLMGLLSGIFLFRYPEKETLKLFCTVGLLGGFTTFSTFSLEALNLFSEGKTGFGVIYMIASVVLCLLAVWLGRAVAQLFS